MLLEMIGDSHGPGMVMSATLPSAGVLLAVIFRISALFIASGCGTRAGRISTWLRGQF